MLLTDKFTMVPVADVKVAPDRQRRSVDVTDLLPSIKARGVYHPIIIDQDYNLIAGERRLRACQELGLSSIPARFSNELSSTERQIIELEENLKRQNLDWKDEARAVEKIHKLYVDMDATWTLTKTADAIGLSAAHISRVIRVAQELEDPKLSAASGIRAASNILSRQDSRAVADTMSELMTAVPKLVGGKVELSAPVKAPAIVNADESILNEDFFSWVKTYSGPPFNLLHCDFPYGINMQKSAQGHTASWGGYEDSPELFWALLDCLKDNMNKLLMPSAHMLFWFAAERAQDVKAYFDRNLPMLDVLAIPLIWVKTDGKGIIADARRRPRHIYECCFLVSRGDRFIVKPVADAYGSPATKETHQSEKPEPMLRHFMQMLVDENTSMLDPTCGSGTSLRAAESLGAKHVLGLEINPEFCEDARAKLRQFRVLRAATKMREDRD